MKIKKSSLFLVVLITFLFCSQAALADRIYINDLINLKDRYLNIKVTVVGQVRETVADPAGTRRGRYTIVDDSTTQPLTVKTNQLPAPGQSYAVTGYVEQDPNNANLPLLREVSRTSPGMPNTMKYLLFGGGFLFLVLLIIFISLLVKPKKQPAPQATVRSVPSPGPVSPDLDKTRKISPSQPEAVPAPDKTQVFMSLGAELVIQRGDDQGKQFTLHKQATTIGRTGARKNDVELMDDTVSKQQATIFYDSVNKQFSIRNESTTNPTKLNNQIITEPVVLKFDDTIEMGKTVILFKKT